MPIVNSSQQFMSARMVLYARCPRCELLFNWVHHTENEELMGAICCDIAFNARLNESGRLSSEFEIFAGEVDWGSNVKPLFG